MRTFAKKILCLINLVFAFLLLLTYLPGIINPGKITVFAFFSLFYPFLLLINIAFIFLWGFFLKKYIFISILAILIRINYVPLYIQNNSPDKNEIENPIKIMSFNAHLFRFGHKNVHPQHVEVFFDLVDKYEPGIICFQEFTSNSQKEDINLIRRFRKSYKLNYYFSLKESKNYVYSNTILSKYPIIKKGSAFENHPDKKFPEQRFIYADLKIGNDTVRVYNVHFSSFHLDEEDKIAYEEIISQQKFDNQKSKKLFGKLARTMKTHGEEVNILSEHIKNTPYRKIVCGDFNDTPASYAYQQLTKQLNDTYRDKGRGIGKTYNGTYPAFRIDYILTDTSFITHDFHVLKEKISDHYPIFSTVSIQ